MNDYEYIKLAQANSIDNHSQNLIIEYNKQLIEKYPFLLPRSISSGEVVKDYDYSYSLLDNMPSGWRIAFGIALCDEIREILITHNYLNEYRIFDIKEKYSSLRWYDNCSSWGIPNVIDKYKLLSFNICIVCGRTATKRSVGWICPYCDTCAIKYSIKCIDINKKEE